MEINRRYGVIKKSDYENYFKMMREVNSLSERSSFNNFAILPGEGELRAKRAAPSDTYMSVLSKTDIKLNLDCETKLDTIGAETYKNMLNTFRERLNDSFVEARGNNASDYNKFVNISYSARIKQAESKMRKESEVERFNTAAQLIRGSDGLASTDVARDFFFHETVVTGLNTLTAITKMLQHIRASVRVMIGAAAANGSIVEIARANGRANPAANPAANYLYNEVGGLETGVLVAAAGGAEALLRDIIILVNGLNNSFGDKVKVRFPQGRTSQLLVDFTDLSNSLEDLMDSTRYFINLMRQTMPRGTIVKYEGTHDNLTEGTYRWLEVNLSDQLLKGKNNQYSTPTADNYSETTTLTYIATEINNMYTYIVHNFNTLRPAISELVYYNAPLSTSVPPAAAAPPAATNLDNSGINFLIADKPATRKAGQSTTVNRSYFNQIIRTWDGTTLNTTRSMMMLFNQLLAMYLRTFYDESSAKTYRGLIESFASGSFNQAVTSVGVQHVFIDLYARTAQAAGGNNAVELANLAAVNAAVLLRAPHAGAAANAGGGVNALIGAANANANTAVWRVPGGGNPAPPTNVLLQSLALILQRLMTDNTREGVSEHLISTLSEVPMFIREKMRAYLPVFSKMFNMVQQQGEFIKQLLEQTDLVLGAHQSKSDAAEVRDRNDMTACINKIVDGCFTLANSSSDVCRELADEPKFLQTQENSIRDYQTRYGKLPLMPLSSVLNYLSILSDGNENRLLPTHSLGTPEFKMMYGTRGLLHDHVWKSSSAPGVSQVLEQYRASSSAGVDESKYEKLVAGVVGVVQSLVDLRYFSTSTTLNTVVTVLGNTVGRVVNTGGGAAIPADMALSLERSNGLIRIGAPSAISNVNNARTAVITSRADAVGTLTNSVFKPQTLFASTVVTPDAGVLTAGDVAVKAAGMGNVNAVFNAGNAGALALSTIASNDRVVYQLKDGIDQERTLSLTESSGQAAQLQHITQAVGSTFSAVTNADSRKIERMYNIVDMNIIPVNVHALMRGMPLAPLYNYTYTFEENARLALGISTAAAAAAYEPTTAREWFYKILEDPYYDVVTTAGPALRQMFDSPVINQVRAIPHPTVYATPAHRAQVVALAATVDDFVGRTWVDPYNTAAGVGAQAGPIKTLVHNVAAAAAPLDDAALAVIVRDTYRLAIQSGAYSTPAAPAEPNTSAGHLIAAVLALNAELDQLFHTRAYETGGVGNAGDASAAGTRTGVISIARNAAAGLLLARNLNMAKLHPAQINEINIALARLLVHAPFDDRTVDDGRNVTDNDRRLVEALNQITEVSVLAAVDALVLTAAANGSPLGIEVAAVGGDNAGTNRHNARVIDVVAEIGILTAMVNNIDRLNRYNLDRHSPNDRTLAALMYGDETLLMGRPKFISDQLFHKVLPTLDSTGHLNYYANGTSTAVAIPAGDRAALREVFEARFNTRIVRNLMHCTNVQRVLRLRLNQELTSYRDVLVNRESITNPSVTEFGNLRWSDMRLDDTRNRTMDPRNEDARSRTYNNSEDVVGIPR
jgi:hypothetical protein